MDDAVGVGEFATRLKQHVNRLTNVRVRGAIGRVTRASSGHVYFELSDAGGRVSCVSWASARLAIESGQAVVRVAKVDFYAPHGRLSAVVDAVAPLDDGWTSDKERVLAKLHGEGLVDRPRRPLPDVVTHLCVVTSVGSAAYHDVMHSIRERWPELRVTVVDTLVQGAEAPTSLCRALGRALALAPSVVVCARGGGSEADLAAFDTEEVARAMCDDERAPIVCAVGHESDHSVCDAVCTVRAKTPTAAIELVLPRTLAERRDEVARARAALDNATRRRLRRAIEAHAALRRAVAAAAGAVVARHAGRLAAQRHALRERVGARLHRAEQQCANQRARGSARVRELLARNQQRLAHARGLLRTTPQLLDTRCRHQLAARRKALDEASPYAMVRHGLAVVRAGKRRVEAVADLRDGDQIELLFADGSASVVVAHRRPRR